MPGWHSGDCTSFVNWNTNIVGSSPSPGSMLVEWIEEKDTWWLFKDGRYQGAVSLNSDGKWHVGIAGSNGPYDYNYNSK